MLFLLEGEQGASAPLYEMGTVLIGYNGRGELVPLPGSFPVVP